MTLLAEVGIGVGIVASLGAAIGGYYKNRSHTDLQIQHLEDTKESKNGLGQKVDILNVGVALVNQKLDEQSKKIETLFDLFNSKFMH